MRNPRITGALSEKHHTIPNVNAPPMPALALPGVILNGAKIEGFGEIVGGSERETDLDILLGRIKEHNLPEKIFSWYLDLRRYGSVPHSGFGLGLERFVSWLTDTKHIRETIPFPRMYGRIEP